MTYLLDTSFLIDYLRGDLAAVARFIALFSEGDRLLISEVIVCELATGFRHAEDPELLALLEPLEFVQPGPASALAAGGWRASARRQGRSLSVPDALIAAAAVAIDATVLTRNVRDFALTPVRLEAY